MIHLKTYAMHEGKKNGPNIKKIDVNGFLVMQGRDAESNDDLTFVVAHDEDLWFHAKGVPGSHVVIRVDGKLPDERVIYRAAEIAARNCRTKQGDIEVVYCKRKFVTKKPGMNPGQVAVDDKNSNKITVTI
jgi:predicted ribosome quality control (RQC) complex YloA/Tae2 family protein